MKNFRGFTLVELLVVIAIIGILVGIIVPNLGTAKSSSRDARRVSDIHNIKLALALYYNDNMHYPCSLTTTGYGVASLCYPDFYPTYMATIPTDPQTPGTQYVYTAQSTATTMTTDGLSCAGNSRTVTYYHLGAVMETTSFTSQDDDKTTAQQVLGAQTAYACSQSNSGARFDGNASNCGGGAAVAPDKCYDVVPN